MKNNKTCLCEQRILTALLLLVFVALFLSTGAKADQVQISIATGNDDAEQSLTDGTMYLGSEGSSSGFLELGYYFWRRDIGLRFQNVTIPQGATINSAVVELTAAATDSSNTRLTVTAEAADNAAQFTSSNNNISARIATAFSVDWNVSNWNNGNTYQSPDISAAIQEIVSRGGWASGNSMVVIIGPDSACSNSNCDRRADEYEKNNDGTDAARLIIDYTPAVVPEHFAISHDSAGDNCTAELVTITKHDVNHAIDTAYAGVITLSTSTGNGSWSLLAGSGTLTTLGGGGATYEFVAADAGQVDLGLANSVAETVNIDITDGTFSEHASEDANLVFSAGGTTTFLDEFNAVSLSGKDGTGDWATNWVETNDDNNASSGDIRVLADLAPYSLRFEGSGSQKSIERSVDLSTATTATFSFDYRRDSLENANEYVAVEIYNDGTASWDELVRIKGPQDDVTYQPASYDISTYVSANTRIRFLSSTGLDAPFAFWYDRIYFDNVQITADAPVVCASTDHFVINHDGLGISCLAEPVSVTAVFADGTTDTSYTGSITLNTNVGAGTWALATGNGNFNGGLPDNNDGIVIYSFDATDNGVAEFDLDYQGGAPIINIAVDDGVIQDDNLEGDLQFSPYGFTVTTSPLAVPFLGVVDTVIPAKISASDFQLYLALYGQTPTDPACGIIEDYNGAKNLKFWSTYNDPSTGTLPVKVNTTNAFANESAADAGVTQSVTFTNGQAAVTVNYADVGQIALNLKDDTVTTALPTGIRGASEAFVVKPAGFVLSNIIRSSDSFANPGTATDENGAAFMAAGENFSVTVTAVNALGNATPNYGQENTPESVALTSTLVAAGAANNPAIGFATGFSGLFSNGMATGTDFHWDEVGIITLTPQVAPTAAEQSAGNPGSYLGASDVVGTVTGNVGRFYPDHFVTATTAGSFANSCTTATPFTYLGESFGYLSNPTLTATAESAVNTTTANYAGAWARLGVAGVSLTYPTADNTQLDESAATAIGVASAAGTLSRADNVNGTLTFTLGGAATDSFAYVRDAGQVPPFTSDLTIQLTSVSDGEASASDLGTPKSINPVGSLQRFGRGYAQDVHGTMSQIGDSLTMSVGSWYLDASATWVLNTDDSCSTYSYTKTDSGITSTAIGASPVSLLNGVGSLVLSVSADAGSPGGSSVIDSVWSGWLQYDHDGVDQLLDGNDYDDSPSATATFGIFRGDDRYLYWRESP